LLPIHSNPEFMAQDALKSHWMLPHRLKMPLLQR